MVKMSREDITMFNDYFRKQFCVYNKKIENFLLLKIENKMFARNIL